MNLLKRLAATAVAMVGLATMNAPTSAADPTSDLRSQVDAARSEAGCAPFQLDPLLNDVAQHTSRDMDAWVNHTGLDLPMLDTTVPQFTSLTGTLRQSGYNPRKARILAGYGDPNMGGPGDNEFKAIKAAVLQGMGFDVFTDCGYTKYGLGIVNDDSSQGWPSTAPTAYSVTVVTVAGD